MPTKRFCSECVHYWCDGYRAIGCNVNTANSCNAPKYLTPKPMQDGYTDCKFFKLYKEPIDKK